MVRLTAVQAPSLPLEIILRIVDCFSPDHPDAIFCASDESTKALVTLTRVCRAIYPAASRLLYQHCVYVDSGERALALVRVLESYAPSAFPWTITKLFLGPYANENELSEGNFPTHEDDADSAQSHTASSPLDDRPLAICIRDLLTILAPALRVLVIDMPLRSLRPEDDVNSVRSLLRKGFSSLVNLEMFVSVRDELYLDILCPRGDERPVWATCWPKLRCLSLYNVDFDTEGIWGWLVGKRQLEMAMFARPDGYDSDGEHNQSFFTWTRLTGIDVKRRWLRALELHGSADGQQRLPTFTTLVFIDSELRVQPDFGRFQPGWRELDPDNKIQVLLADVPGPRALEDAFVEQPEVDHIERTQEFVKRLALEGTLWDRDALWMRRI